MTIQGVSARGSQWSAAELYDGWGNETSEAQCQALGDLVVERFHALALGRGYNLTWFPSTSEVIGDRDQDHPDLDELRQQATGSVWDDYIAGKLELPD